MQAETRPENGPDQGLPSYDSVDLNRALELMGGREAILMEVCRAAIREFPQELEKIETFLKKGDIKAAHRAAHSLKSGARSIGADRAARMAQEIEVASARKNGNRAAQLLPDLFETFNQLLVNLEDYIRLCEDTTTPQNPDQTRQN